jgi:hypothetical protein
MTGWIEEEAFRMEGFTDAQRDQIMAILPDLEHLAGVVRAELPRINRVVPVIQMAIAVFNAKQKELGS